MSKILVALLFHSIIFILQAQAFHDDIGNLAKLRETFDKNAATISTMTKRLQSDSKDKVIMLGSTGSGKDTFINYLAKKRLIVNELYCLDVEDALEGTRIGHESSTTRTPVPWVSPDNTVFWNCPGFGDTAGVEQDILNMCMIRQIVNGNTKLLLLYPGAEIDANRSSLMRMIGNILTMYSLDNLNGRFGLVITKKFAHRDASLFLKQYVERMRQGECSDDNALAEIDYISTNNLVMRFPEPTEVGLYPTNYLQPIIDTINRLQYMNAGYLKHYPDIPAQEKNIVEDLPYSQGQIRYLQETFGYLHELGVTDSTNAAIEKAYYIEKNIFLETLPAVLVELNKHYDALGEEVKKVHAIRSAGTLVLKGYGTFKEESKDYRIAMLKTAIEAISNLTNKLQEKEAIIRVITSFESCKSWGLVAYFIFIQAFLEKPLLQKEHVCNVMFLSSLSGNLFKDSQNICTAREMNNIQNFFKELAIRLADCGDQVKNLTQCNINNALNISNEAKAAVDNIVRPIRIAAINFRIHVDPIIKMLFIQQSEDFYNELAFQMGISLLTREFLLPSSYPPDFEFPCDAYEEYNHLAKVLRFSGIHCVSYSGGCLSQQEHMLDILKEYFLGNPIESKALLYITDILISRECILFAQHMTLRLVLGTSRIKNVLNAFNVQAVDVCILVGASMLGIGPKFSLHWPPRDANGTRDCFYGQLASNKLIPAMQRILFYACGFPLSS